MLIAMSSFGLVMWVLIGALDDESFVLLCFSFCRLRLTIFVPCKFTP